MKKRLSDKTFNLIFSIAAIVAMWAAWVIAYRIEANEYVVPSFTDSMKEAAALLADSAFWQAFANTLLRTIEAFAISFVLAAVLSAVAAISSKFAAFMRPIMAALRTIPTMAIILILLLWTTPLLAPVIVALLVTFPLVYAQFAAAFGGIDTGLVQMAKLYGVPRRERLFKIYIPAVLPNIIAQSGAAFSLTLKIMVSAEVMSRTYMSIGGLMQDARNYLQISQLFALTVITVVAGGVSEWLLGRLNIFTRKWGREGTAEATEYIAPHCRGLGRRKIYYYGGSRRALYVKGRRRR